MNTIIERVSRRRQLTAEVIAWALEHWDSREFSRADRYSLNLIGGMLTTQADDLAAMCLCRVAAFGLMAQEDIDREPQTPRTRVDCLLNAIHLVCDQFHSATDWREALDAIDAAD